MLFEVFSLGKSVVFDGFPDSDRLLLKNRSENTGAKAIFLNYDCMANFSPKPAGKALSCVFKLPKGLRAGVLPASLRGEEHGYVKITLPLFEEFVKENSFFEEK